MKRKNVKGDVSETSERPNSQLIFKENENVAGKKSDEHCMMQRSMHDPLSQTLHCGGSPP
jgi:hypothetical protein